MSDEVPPLVTHEDDVQKQEVDKIETWQCSKCPLVSLEPDRTDCAACGALRPRVISSPSASVSIVTPAPKRTKTSVKPKTRLLPGEAKCALCWSYPDAPEAEGPLQIVADPTACSANMRSGSGLLPGPLFVHEDCALFCPQVRKGKEGLLNVSAEIRRGWPLKCTMCHAKGALYGCHKNSCRRTYHYMCAKKAGCVMDQYDHTIHCKTCWNDVFEADSPGLKTERKSKKDKRVEGEHSDDSEDEDTPIKSKKAQHEMKAAEEVDTDDESLLVMTKSNQNGSGKKKKKPVVRAEESDDDEDAPIGLKMKQKMEKEDTPSRAKRKSPHSSSKKAKSPQSSLVKAGEKKCIFCCSYSSEHEISGDLIKVARPEQCEKEEEFNSSLSTAPCWVHKKCALFSPRVFQNTKDEMMNISLEIKRGWLLKCHQCRQIGGLYGCWNNECKKSFHLQCAAEAGLVLNTKEWSIYCPGCVPGAPRQRRVHRSKDAKEAKKAKTDERISKIAKKKTIDLKDEKDDEGSSSLSSDTESSSCSTTTSSDEEEEDKVEEQKSDEKNDSQKFLSSLTGKDQRETAKINQAIASLELLAASAHASSLASHNEGGKKLATKSFVGVKKSSVPSSIASSKAAPSATPTNTSSSSATATTAASGVPPAQFALIPLGKKNQPGYQARQEARAHSWRDEGKSRLVNVILPTPLPPSSSHSHNQSSTSSSSTSSVPTVIVTSSSFALPPKSILKSASVSASFPSTAQRSQSSQSSFAPSSQSAPRSASHSSSSRAISTSFSQPSSQHAAAAALVATTAAALKRAHLPKESLHEKSPAEVNVKHESDVPPLPLASEKSFGYYEEIKVPTPKTPPRTTSYFDEGRSRLPSYSPPRSSYRHDRYSHPQVHAPFPPYSLSSNPYSSQPFVSPLVTGFPSGSSFSRDMFPNSYPVDLGIYTQRRHRSRSRDRHRSHRSSSRDRHRRSRSRDRRSRSRDRGSYSRDKRSRSRERRRSRSRSRERRPWSPVGDHKRISSSCKPATSLGRMDVKREEHIRCLASERGECNDASCALLHGKCATNSSTTCINRMADRTCPDFWSGKGCAFRHLIPTPKRR